MTDYQQTLDFAAAQASADDRLRNLGLALAAVNADDTLRFFSLLVFNQTRQGASGCRWEVTRERALQQLWAPHVSTRTLSSAIKAGIAAAILTVEYSPRDTAAGYSINWAGVALAIGKPAGGNFQHDVQKFQGALKNLQPEAQKFQGALKNLQDPPEQTHNISAQAQAPVACSDLNCSDDVDNSSALEIGSPDWPLAIATARKMLSMVYDQPKAIVPDEAIEVALSAAALSQAMGDEGEVWIHRAIDPCLAKHVTNKGGYLKRMLVVGLIDTLGHHAQTNLANPDQAKKLAGASFNEALRRLRPDVRKHLHGLRRTPAVLPAPTPPLARIPTASDRQEALTAVPDLRAAFREVMQPRAP